MGHRPSSQTRRADASALHICCCRIRVVRSESRLSSAMQISKILRKFCHMQLLQSCLSSVTGHKLRCSTDTKPIRTSKSTFLSLNSQSYFSDSRRQTTSYSSRTFDWRLAKISPKLEWFNCLLPLQ